MSRTPADQQEERTRPPNGLDRLDALLQHRSRLGAMVLLSGADAINFSRLRGLLDETDGNLGAQLRKLEDAGYVAVKKEFVERKPVSWYALTPEGRKALKAHLAALEALVREARV
jgi:DNA-binding MarR family transcriptional regulator